MSDDLLHVLLAGRRVGHVQHAGGRLTFAYEAPWRDSRNGFPLSLSMPLAQRVHAHDRIHPYLWGLLPDNPRTLQAWSSRFHVSAGNAFRILEHVGEDCAGAVQLVTAQRLREVISQDATAKVQWLSAADVAERLRRLREDAGVTRLPSDAGQFSLAGAQAKTALHLGNERWGVPSGDVPTTHIFKPPMPDLAGHIENEHLMLTLAARVGLRAATSEVLTFEDETAIVVRRYDRLLDPRSGRIKRVHQEDMCQALAVLPHTKYQNEGGPTPEQIVTLLREHSSDPSADVAAFVDALLFNWIIGGTDAHAKNYSLLLSGGGQARLAPLYDLASALPYDDLDQRRLKLAMKIGDSYHLHRVRYAEWKKFAQKNGLDPAAVVARGRTLAESVAANIDMVCLDSMLTHPLVEVLRQQVKSRAQALC